MSSSIESQGGNKGKMDPENFMEPWLTNNPISGMILWIILYISDYYMTLRSARGYKEIGHFRFEKSFELTPQFQKDIDSLAPVSKRHITLLIVITSLILLLWWALVGLLHLEWAYALYLGMFLLLEVAIHVRHFRSLFLIRTLKKEGGVEGEIKYLQHFSYRISAYELNSFAVLFLITSVITFSPFFLGGAIACAAVGSRHNYYAKKSLKDKNANPL